MDVQRKKYITGLSITSLADEFGRVTEIWRGYEEVILVHKGLNNEGDSMRRYTLSEFKALTEVMMDVFDSRPPEPIDVYKNTTKAID